MFRGNIRDYVFRAKTNNSLVFYGFITEMKYDLILSLNYQSMFALSFPFSDTTRQN